MNRAAAPIRAAKASSPRAEGPAAPLASAAATRARASAGSPASYMDRIRATRSALGAGSTDGDQDVTGAAPRIISGMEGAMAMPRSLRPDRVASGRAASDRLAQPSASPNGVADPFSSRFWPSKWERSR